MSRNEIRLDQIQQRLGSHNKQRPSYDDYDTISTSRDNSFDNLEDEPTTLNAGFIATIVGAFMAVGAGTYFFAGSDIQIPDLGLKLSWGDGELVAATSGSVLDPVCGKGWRTNLPNNDQMHCFMTKQVYRLCDADEHKALIATIRQYDKDYKVWHRKFTIATFKTIGKMQTQGLQLGMEAAKMEHMKGSEKQKLDQLGKVVGMADNIMKPTNDLLGEINSKVKSFELAQAAEVLAKKGYISPDDFGRSKPDFIESAFKSAGNVKTACPNRG